MAVNSLRIVSTCVVFGDGSWTYPSPQTCPWLFEELAPVVTLVKRWFYPELAPVVTLVKRWF